MLTVTTGAGGSFSDDTFGVPTEQQAISIQAAYGDVNSNTCPEDDGGPD